MRLTVGDCGTRAVGTEAYILHTRFILDLVLDVESFVARVALHRSHFDTCCLRRRSSVTAFAELVRIFDAPIPRMGEKTYHMKCT